MILFLLIVIFTENHNSNILHSLFCCCCHNIICHRCVYELFVAQKLRVKIKLCSHIHDSYVVAGLLCEDICLQNIGTSVDSENAVCSCEPDKIAIHKAIKSLFSNGFVKINQFVEMIHLTCLLEYEVEKITGFQIDYNESHEQNSEATKKKR